MRRIEDIGGLAGAGALVHVCILRDRWPGVIDVTSDRPGSQLRLVKGGPAEAAEMEI
ncbi:hypothetical protein [Saccharopolyspora sp. NPDC002376]